MNKMLFTYKYSFYLNTTLERLKINHSEIVEMQNNTNIIENINYTFVKLLIYSEATELELSKDS